jgi:hypothetical protein
VLPLRRRFLDVASPPATQAVEWRRFLRRGDEVDVSDAEFQRGYVTDHDEDGEFSRSETDEEFAERIRARLRDAVHVCFRPQFEGDECDACNRTGTEPTKKA